MAIDYTDIPSGKYCTVQQIVTEYGISHRTVLNYLVLKRFPVFYIGKGGHYYLIEKSDVERFAKDAVPTIKARQFGKRNV